jgi:hypothetical protein
VAELGLEHVMFEAAEPEVFSWYIKNYGIDVNLFVDHSQIVQLEGLRAGIWGTHDTWAACSPTAVEPVTARRTLIARLVQDHELNQDDAASSLGSFLTRPPSRPRRGPDACSGPPRSCSGLGRSGVRRLLRFYLLRP